MRSLAFVLLLLCLALVTLLSFVPHSGAASAPATVRLDYLCHPPDASPPVLPAGVPSLVACTATVTNIGDATLHGASITFEPDSVLSPPDQYCFFSAVHDGVDLPVICGDTSYSFGDIEPGARSVIALRIIVLPSHEYGADVVLRDGSGTEYARLTVRGEVTDVVPPLLPAVKLYRTDPAAGTPSTFAGPSASYLLVILNSAGHLDYDDVTVEMPAPVPEGGIAFSESNTWPSTGPSGHLVGDLGAIPSGGSTQRALKFTPTEAYAGTCSYLSPILLVTAKRGDASDTRVVMGDGTTFGTCEDQSMTASPQLLPISGSGPTNHQPPWAAVALIALLVGTATLLLGRPTSHLPLLTRHPAAVA